MADPESKGSLPHGWLVRTSKRYPNRIYYFNIVTGSSTWECPELDPPREIPKVDTDVSAVDVKNTLEAASIKLKLHRESRKVSPDVSKSSKQETRNFNSYPSTNDIIKLHVPPTAVVVPVIHKQENQTNSSLVQKPYLDLNDSSSTTVKKLKRKSDTLEDTTSDESKKEVLKCAKKKKKTSPLNRSDPVLERKLKGEKDLSNDTVESKEADDIEMLDVSMDIIEDAAEKETIVDTFASYYIVVDTNILISELHLINEVKDTPLDGCGPPHIFIPWVVIQELDKLKSNKNTMRSACEAVRYLNSVLGKHPRFHGQSPAEAEDWAKTYSKCNDDRLLECCMALGDKMSPEKVILLTNDKNLVNKALICNITVHNWTSMMKSVKPDVVFSLSKNKENRRNNERDCNKSVSTNESSKSPNDIQQQMIIHQRDIYKREIHTLMCTARQLLKDVIIKFVEKEMNRAYGRNWVSSQLEANHVGIKKRLLGSMLQVIITNWKVVFCEFMNEKDKRNFVLLHKTASRPEGFLDDKEECLVSLSTIEDVFRQIKKNCPEISIPVEKIEEFRAHCVEHFNTYCKLESTIKEAEQTSSLAVFERNWSIINQLCGMVLDFCEIEHDIQYDKPNELPPEGEFRLLLCNLYPGVQQLKTLMFKMLDYVQNNKPTKFVAKKLYNALIGFIPSLEIPYEPASYVHFSVQALEKFCVCPQNREMIEIGCKQIEKFFSKLDEALNALMSARFRKKCTSPETMICD